MRIYPLFLVSAGKLNKIEVTEGKEINIFFWKNSCVCEEFLIKRAVQYSAQPFSEE
jgi:hypothetical protein